MLPLSNFLDKLLLYMGGILVFELFSFKTIRGKFFLLTTIIILVPMLILSIAVYRISAQKLTDNAVRNAESSLEIGEHYLDRIIIDLYDLLIVVQGNPQIQELLNKADIEGITLTGIKG